MNRRLLMLCLLLCSLAAGCFVQRTSRRWDDSAFDLPPGDEPEELDSDPIGDAEGDHETEPKPKTKDGRN